MSRAGAACYCAWAFTSANFHQYTPKISFLWCCLHPPVQIDFHTLISSEVLNSVRVFARTKIPSISFRGWISLKHWSEKYGHFYLYNCLFLILITNRRCGNSGVLWAVQFLIKCSQSAGLLWSPWGENSIMRPKALWLHPISNFTLIIFIFFFFTQHWYQKNCFLFNASLTNSQHVPSFTSSGDGWKMCTRELGSVSTLRLMWMETWVGFC